MALSAAAVTSVGLVHAALATSSVAHRTAAPAAPSCAGLAGSASARFLNRKATLGFRSIVRKQIGEGRSAGVVCEAGDVVGGQSFLIGGAILVGLIGTAYPLLFAKKGDTCPTCGGAGFVRKSGGRLAANAARKDQQEIVCQTCKGLGKVGVISKN
ncbi:hypothetical protein KFL_000670190 [Klebsormidium nitens]|uniref:CR-type domain-containing protein n=1 Tax=Klebsormidium nitens TaxID=105231 RepID=A0A1Y1HVF6_KLENI|nr:hypothetical protein KFL_000670190 [Klebsormidium nitens]|eukprot:GAQ80961.1 hypothetical protein KFL_000670190 [Klebsormidium nitens]